LAKHDGSPVNLFLSSSPPKAGQTPVLLKKYERKTANHLFWAPTGQFVVLAGLRSMNGCLEFVDTGDFTTMGTGEHFMCTDVEWDPTGRSAVYHPA
jgi:translation initiation factor 3 subunit B